LVQPPVSAGLECHLRMCRGERGLTSGLVGRQLLRDAQPAVNLRAATGVAG
jgi:hypothetical protein